jgi:hypothetical protein
MTVLSWNDPALQVRSDAARTARYRLLQSWYREHVLHVGYGTYRVRGVVRPCGSLLDPDAVAERPGLNLLSARAAEYARQRSAEVVAAGGTLEVGRLRHNMLSSMPLCFSIFGELRGSGDRRIGLVRSLFDPFAVAVDAIECELTPDTDVLGDRTAFDAMVVTRRDDGSRHLIGIETKYTERFSQTPYLADRYLDVHLASGWFRDGSERSLVPAATNQLWRNTLLAAACEQLGELGLSSAAVCVVALADDRGAATALAGVRASLVDPDARCRFVSIESIEAHAKAADGEWRAWAEGLGRRYVVLTPVESATTGSQPRRTPAPGY